MKHFSIFFLSLALFLNGITYTASAQTWSAVGTGLNAHYGRIESMCEYHGDLYAGGYFDSIGSLKVNSLAKWNGVSWDSIPGMTAFGDLEIFDMVVYHNQLVIVGNQIHAWDGTSWSNLGGLVDNRQFAVDVYNDELYITGHFEYAGGVYAKGIARWNGVMWSDVGGPGLTAPSGFSGSALQTYDNDLYVAGGFSAIVGVPLNSIGKWNGNVWDSVGAIQPFWAFQSLCEYNNKLYAGGLMSINNEPDAHWITRWNGISWDSAGAGLNYVPRCMTVFNNELYAAGDFDSAGNIQTLGIARWNDVQWNTVGSGLDLLNINIDTIPLSWMDTMYIKQEHIYTLYAYNNELYAGGDFSMIGGINASGIAKWHIPGASVGEQESITTLSVYPNPAKDHINLHLSASVSKGEIHIYNSLGQIISSTPVTGNELAVDVTTLSPGLYIIEVNTQGKVSRQRFIKN